MASVDKVDFMKKSFRKRRDLMIKLLSDIPNIKVNEPKGAFYLFPDVSYYFGKSYGEHKIKNADDLSMYLLADGQVATTGGDAFGNPENIRISYATSEDKLIEAAKRIKTHF